MPKTANAMRSSARVLALCAFVAACCTAGFSYAANRTVVGELWSADG